MASRSSTSPAVDPAKSFLIFETRSNSNRPVASIVRGRIPIACANPCTTIEFERVTDEGAPATINIQWYVVTFVTGVRVQRGETAQDALVKDVTLPLTLSAVNQAFVIWSKTRAPGPGELGHRRCDRGRDHQHDQSAVPEQ